MSVEKVTTFFENEKMQIPVGFKVVDDVDITAPRLFSDKYVLNYIYQMKDWVIGLFN